MSQENIQRKNGGSGTMVGMQSPTKSSGLRCQQAMGAGPWLTVIVPAYNEAEWVGETVRSLREQTRAPAEIIVVDDREKP